MEKQQQISLEKANALVMHNYFMPVSLARRTRGYRGPCEDFEAAVQEGRLALIELSRTWIGEDAEEFGNAVKNLVSRKISQFLYNRARVRNRESVAYDQARLRGPSTNIVELKDTVANVLAMCIPEDAELLRLHHMEGWTIEELAEMNGTDVRSIRTMVDGAMRRSRKRIFRRTSFIKDNGRKTTAFTYKRDRILKKRERFNRQSLLEVLKRNEFSASKVAKELGVSAYIVKRLRRKHKLQRQHITAEFPELVHLLPGDDDGSK